MSEPDWRYCSFCMGEDKPMVGGFTAWICGDCIMELAEFVKGQPYDAERAKEQAIRMMQRPRPPITEQHQ